MQGKRLISETKRRTFWLGILAAWIGCVGIGLAALARYSGTPGPQTAAPRSWPTTLAFRPAPQGTTLLVCIHPQCPCSAATLGELARLMAVRQNSVRAYVLIGGPREEDLIETARWEEASAIPGVTVLADLDGATAAQLGAMTSGHVFAFNPTGQVLFSGGITPARSHMGESIGGDALRSLVRGGPCPRQTAPVFGCSLEHPSDAPPAGDAR